MASILGRKNKFIKPLKYLGIGLGLFVAGVLSFNFLGSVISTLKDILNGMVSALKDVPLNGSTMVAALLVLASGFFIYKGADIIRSSIKGSQVESILSKLPEGFYVMNESSIDKSVIDHIIICPKGIFTINSSHDKPGKKEIQKRSMQYDMVKQGILNSKKLNDYLQKNKHGNYFVNTIIVYAQWDEKLKGHFPDIPVLKPDELSQHFDKLADKFTANEARQLADALHASLSAQTVEANQNKPDSKNREYIENSDNTGNKNTLKAH